MFDRKNSLVALALLGAMTGIGGGVSHGLQLPYVPPIKYPSARQKRGQTGSKLGKLAANGRVGITGGRAAYGDWQRIPREERRIRNRKMRNAGMVV